MAGGFHEGYRAQGRRGSALDNTIEAMEEAVRFGVKEIETDVRATADGRLVICHDAMIWGRVVAGPISPGSGR